MPILLLKRYLPSYLLSVLVSLAVWIGLLVAFDGWIPVTASLAFVAIAVGFLPYMAYRDLCKVKGHMKKLNAIFQGNENADEYVDTLTSYVAEKSGIPESVVSLVSNRVKKLSSTAGS